jgi:hypothetical protein
MPPKAVVVEGCSAASGSTLCVGGGSKGFMPQRSAAPAPPEL